MAGGLNMYVYEYVSLLAPDCAVCLCDCAVCVCVYDQITVPAKNHITCQTLVNLMPCCIKHTSRSFWY